jgi:[calcium/calmodulin-dependent protein kinase] kinase
MMPARNNSGSGLDRFVSTRTPDSSALANRKSAAETQKAVGNNARLSENIAEAMSVKHPDVNRRPAARDAQASDRNAGSFPSTRAGPSSAVAPPVQRGGADSQGSLDQVLQSLESAGRRQHRVSNSGSMTSNSSEVSTTSTSSSVRAYESTKHTDSVTKSSVKMGEMEYSQFNQYIIIKDLGRGVHARVMLGLNTADNLLYAIKVTNSNAAVAETAVRKEIAVLKKLNHNNVLKLFEVIDDQNSNELLLILEYASAGPIFTRYNRIPVKEGVLHSYMRDIIQGLDYLHHAVGIAHMDLKPENLLKSSDGTVKIADFGVSFIGNNAQKPHKRIVGTPAFIAPEMLGDVGYDPYIADIWSLGICIFHMATAQLPFIGKTIFQIIAMAKRQGLRFPPLPDLSHHLRDLISIILEVDPLKRATVSEIMSHPWITANGEMPLPVSLAYQPGQIYVTEEEVQGAIRADPLAALLTPVFKSMHFAPGEFIMRKDELGYTMFFINSGECEVLMDALDDDENDELGADSGGRSKDSDPGETMAVLAVRTAGQFIGEMAVLEAIQKGTAEAVGKRTASVRARAEVDCLSVTGGDILAALEKDEGGRERLLRTASIRLEQNEEIMAQLVESKMKKSKSEMALAQAEFAPSRPLQVLYAEDSVPTQFIVKRLMKRIGNVELTCVNDGKAALEHCKKCAGGEMVRPDIILMDCQMPVMNGLDASTAIRALADPAVRGVPIVAVSSGIKHLNEKECMDAGMDDYVAKPLNQETLVDVLVRNRRVGTLSSPRYFMGFFFCRHEKLYLRGRTSWRKSSGYFAVTNQLMTASMVHVTDLTPGSDNQNTS